MSTDRRLTKLEKQMSKVLAGRHPSSSQRFGAGQGGKVRLYFATLAGGDADPFIEFNPDAGPDGSSTPNGIPAFQLAADGLTPVTVGPGSQLLHVFNYVSPGSAVTLSTSWAEYGKWHLLLQGGFISLPSTALHRISLYASTTTDGANVRMYDVTNSQTLWTVTGIDTSAGFHATTTVANLPSGDARMRIDAQSTAGTPDLTIEWLSWWAIV